MIEIGVGGTDGDDFLRGLYVCLIYTNCMLVHYVLFVIFSFCIGMARNRRIKESRSG